jgi:hypothetical protein
MLFTDFKFPLQKWLYRTAILSLLHGCGVMVVAEAHTNLGRADLVVSYCDVTWVIEIKVAYEGKNPAKKVEEALKQIEDNNYATPYVHPVCVGLAIDDAVRQITNYEKM